MKLKNIEDYYEQVHERFPDLEMWEIEKILKHGFQSFYMLNARGADVTIKSPKLRLVMYFGKLFNHMDTFAKYYNIKWRIKLRLKYKLNNPIWDGYYYFGLSQEDYNKYIPKKGKIKQGITFENFNAFKIKEEAALHKEWKYFYRVSVKEDTGFRFASDSFFTRKIEYLGKRNSNNIIEWI